MKFQGYKNPNQIQKKKGKKRQHWKNTYRADLGPDKIWHDDDFGENAKVFKQRRIVFKISNIIVLNQNNQTIGISSVIFLMTLF